ncbi:hypothetical protein GWN26_03730, partial [Candidatus Saccharibacteria bacterium]|nr:hypothetical protein [Candidatus Saccharibacteria bacterium]
STPDLVLALKKAASLEDEEQKALIIGQITENNVEQAVVKALGEELEHTGDDNQQTILIESLKEIDHVDSVHPLGKFLLEEKSNVSVREWAL